jgi:hypothetical protein
MLYVDLTQPRSLNKYQYSYNNPLRYVDPDGHEADEQEPRPVPGQALPVPVVPVRPPIPIGVPPTSPGSGPYLPCPGPATCPGSYIFAPDQNAIPSQPAEAPAPVPLPDLKPDINKPVIPSDTQIRFGENPNKPIVTSPESKKGRKQVFKDFPTRKRAIDARPRPVPAKPGEPRVTRQGKNKKGMGTQTEKHKRGGRHVHDDRHNKKNKPNVHYGVRGK